MSVIYSYKQNISSSSCHSVVGLLDCLVLLVQTRAQDCIGGGGGGFSWSQDAAMRAWHHIITMSEYPLSLLSRRSQRQFHCWGRAECHRCLSVRCAK